MKISRSCVLLAGCTLSMWCGLQAEEGTESAGVLDLAGPRGGLCIHLGKDAHLAAELAREGRFLVRSLVQDDEAFERTRQIFRQAGVSECASAGLAGPKAWPFADRLANLVVAEDMPSEATLREIVRVLTPHGIALFGKISDEALANAKLDAAGLGDISFERRGSLWARATKPWPQDLDEWPQWRHGADGNAVSQDREVGPPSRLKWIDGRHAIPLGLRDQALISAGGRLFTVTNEAEPDIRGPARPYLTARNAFNGLILWRRKVPSFCTENMDASFPQFLFPDGAFLATRERVYLVLEPHGPLVALDAASGEQVAAFKAAGSPQEARLQDGTLVLRGGGMLRAVDVASGVVRWATAVQGSGHVQAADKSWVDGTLEAERFVLGPRSAFVQAGFEVVALNLDDGKERWRAKLNHVGDLSFYAAGIVAVRNGRGGGACALDAETGALLWTYKYPSNEGGRKGYRFTPDFFRDGLYWVNAEPDDEQKKLGYSTVFTGLDPRSGEVKRRLPNRARANVCGPNTITARFAIMGKDKYFNFETGAGGDYDLTRAGCGHGYLAANGMLYNLPHTCMCVVALRGVMATEYADASVFKPDPLDAPGRFVSGAVAEQLETAEGSGDWSVYRGDPERSGCAASPLGPKLKALWTRDLQAKISSPVCASGRLYVAAVDAHQIVALDATTGEALWRYTAEGRIDTPPTLHQGLCLFGTRTGWVHCLSADQGKLIWKFRAAPAEHWITAYGQLESSWPVHGSVLVRENAAYFAAGRSSDALGGLRIYCADPATGKLRWTKEHRSVASSYGVDFESGGLRWEKASELHGTANLPGRTGNGTGRSRDILLDDLLVAGPEGVLMRNWSFAAADGESRYQGGPHLSTERAGPSLLVETAFLKDTYSGWNAKGVAGQMVVFDAKHVFAFKHNGNLGAGCKLFCSGETEWSTVLPLRIKAMLLAGETLFVAGFAEQGEGGSPWSGWDGELGGQLWALRASNGEPIEKHALERLPVFDGMAAAQGRLYLSLEGGKIVCFQTSAHP